MSQRSWEREVRYGGTSPSDQNAARRAEARERHRNKMRDEPDLFAPNGEPWPERCSELCCAPIWPGSTQPCDLAPAHDGDHASKHRWPEQREDEDI